jgi:hypothetical protein
MRRGADPSLTLRLNSAFSRPDMLAVDCKECICVEISVSYYREMYQSGGSCAGE